MKTNAILILIVGTSLFISCSGNAGKTPANTQNSQTQVQIKNDTISKIYDHYTLLKDALVKSDPKVACMEGAELQGLLNKIQGCETTAGIAKEIGGSNDIAFQRTKFLKLSSDIIPMIKAAKLSSGSIFVLFCPMADKGNGGYWMASNKEVTNPYYGSEMLDCGEVKEEIKTQ